MFQHCSYARQALALTSIAASSDVDVDFGYVSDESAGGVFMHARIFRNAGQISLIPFGSIDGVNYFELPTALWQLGLTPAAGQFADRYIRLDGAVPSYLRLRLSTGGAWSGDVEVNLRASAPIYAQ